MKKKLFKLSIVILGALMCLGFNKVQASQITSAFTGEKLNRNNVKALNSIATFGDISNTPITIERKASGYKYNTGTDGQGQDVWEFVNKDENDKHIYYCLNKEKGFNTPGENTQAYTLKEELTKDLLKTYGATSSQSSWMDQTTYNKLLWILDNMYVPSETTTDDTIYDDPDFIELLKKSISNSYRLFCTIFHLH